MAGMKPKSLLVVISILFFVGGNVINLLFSSNLLWGEMEARLFTLQTGSKTLSIDCPLMIAPWESATIHTTVINTSDQDTKPQVNAFISTQKGSARVESQTLELKSLDSVALQWTVDASDVVFDRLILVSILQRPYRNLESRQGTCSIYVYSLFGMNGRNTLLTITELGVILSVLGIGLMHYLLHPLAEQSKKIMQVNILFLVLVLLGLFSSLQRMWGLTLFFNATALLSVTVAYIDILFYKNR